MKYESDLTRFVDACLDVPWNKGIGDATKAAAAAHAEAPRYTSPPKKSRT